MQGFKTFFAEGELDPVNLESGYAELLRLERGHHFFAIQTNHESASGLMRGRLTGKDLEKSVPFSSLEIEKLIFPLQSEMDTLLVVCFPKRWERDVGRQNIREIFAKMVGDSKKSSQYVWGAYSLWNPLNENHDMGHFFRNPLYHANDDLLNIWLQHHPTLTREKSPVPLEYQPRTTGQAVLSQGRHTFHGYREPKLPGI